MPGDYGPWNTMVWFMSAQCLLLSLLRSDETPTTEMSLSSHSAIQHPTLQVLTCYLALS